MKKKICIIYTGGTIGMKPTENGFSPEQNYLGDVIKNMEEISSKELPDFDFVEFTPLLDSSNVGVEQWNSIGQEISDKKDLYDGFVVLHGTDTMAYTASALSFMVIGLGKPVILTGSQIPLGMVRSDGRENLITSMLLASDDRISEVCIFFGGKLLRGNRTVKVSADTLQAFDSPNFQTMGEAGVKIKIDETRMGQKCKVGLSEYPFEFTPFENNQIAVMKIFPGIQYQIFNNIITEDLKAIVIEGFGAGNIPQNSLNLIEILKKAHRLGIFIVVCTQCYKGSAEIGMYEASKDLKEINAICGFDITVEAAVTKMYYLLSKNYSSKEIRELMGKDICGEITVENN